jgi:hypothetical protein
MFGYALLEENRPRKEYWNMVFKYTIVLLSIKIIINLSIFDGMLDNEKFQIFSSYAKIGIYNYDNLP